MRNYISMAAPRMPDNALINFDGLNNALMNYRKQRNYDEEVARQEEAKNYARGRAGRSDGDQAKALFGKQAMAVDGMDGETRAAAWKSILAKHPNAASLSPDYLDPMKGPKLVMAEAGIAPQQPAAGKTYEVGGRLVEVQPGGGVREIYSAPEKPDPIKEMLMQRLQGQGRPQPQAAPQPQAPMLQPQSFQAPQQGANPLLQLAAERVTDQAQPAPSMPEPTAPEMIDTPYGPMTRQDAQQMGGAMLLDPRYQAAGKQLLDSLAAGKGQLSKPAETQLDERTISAASTLGRLQSIKRQFKPEFQQIPTKLKLLGASWGAAFGGTLSPEIQKQLGDFAEYKATAFDNFNQLLKELSGTAVSAQELERQQIVQPNPGNSLLGGDDPVTFQAKINAGERIAKAAIARMNYMRNRGVQFNKDTAEQFLRLEDVPAAIDRRGAEIEAELRRANPQADPMSIEREAMNRVKQEFGI